MKNEALRLFLAVAALIITAMITNTSGSLGELPAAQRAIAGQSSELNLSQTTEASQNKEHSNSVDKKTNNKKLKKTAAVKTVHKASRSFAFFFRR